MISPWMGDRYTLQNPQSFTSVANVHSTAHHRLYNDGDFDVAFCIQVCTMMVSLTWRFVYRYITGMYNDGEFDLAFCIQVCTMTVSLTWRFVYRYVQ